MTNSKVQLYGLKEGNNVMNNQTIFNINQVDNMMKNTILRFLGITLLASGYLSIPSLAIGQSTSQQKEASLTYLQTKEILWNSNPVINIELQNSSLEEALIAIAKQAKAGLYYDAELVPDQTVSFDSEGKPLGVVLREVLKDTQLEAYTSGRNIILREKEVIEDNTEFNTDNLTIVQETINGIVVDAQTGEALPGVNIVLNETTIGTSTNSNGEFELTVPSLDQVLVVSYIGYETQEVSIDNRVEIEITLIPQELVGEELVVIGYGAQRQVNVIGSISTISTDDITAASVPNLSNSLAGRLPGLLVQQRSGEPGFNEADILVRGRSTLGNNAPLVVIDGIQGRDLNSINASDVESISILKDASAAIYGSRAANGVILITTKSGISDTPPTLTYEFYEGFLSPTMLPEMADSPTYARMIREMQSYRGVDESNMAFSLDDIAKFESGEFPWTHPNTNWFDAALADYSRTRKHDISVGGGTSNTNYYVSLGTLMEDGIYTNSATTFERINLRAKVDIDINEYIDIGFDIHGSRSNRSGSTKSANSIFSSLIRSFPHEHAVFPNTNLPGPDIEYGDQPMVSPSIEPGFNEDIRNRGDIILRANFQVPRVEGLYLNGYYSYDKIIRNDKFFETPFTLYSFNQAQYLSDGNTGVEDGSDYIIPFQAGLVPEPRLTDLYDEQNTSAIHLRANYNRTIKRVHNFSSFVAYENSKTEGEGFHAFRRHFQSDQLPYLFAGGNADKDNDGWVFVDSRENYFGRLSYDYDDTYLLQISFRRDGSLRFSEESGRWGNFPSVLVGWRPSQHTWWSNYMSFINDFKLRASWAKMGNDLVPPFQYLQSYEFGPGVVMGANRNFSSALSQSGTPNPFISWEVATVYNFGFESSLLNYNLNFEVDLFFERRSDILVQRDASVPKFTGISLPDENFGIVENKGIELVLGYNIVQPDFSFGINGNLAFARNKIIEVDEPERSVPWQILTGHPQGSRLLYKSNGIFRDEEHVNSLPHVPGARPGDIIIEDINGDGQITPDDRIVFPLTADPEITYGVSFNVGYRNWHLSGLVQGVSEVMRQMYTDTRQGTAGNYFQFDADDRWTPDNIDASKPRAFERSEEYWRGSFLTDYNFENNAFARLKNLRITYTIPQSIQNAISLRDAQIYVSGQNLFLIYSGSKIMDPELGNMNNYPLMRTLSMGAKISL